MNCDNVIIIGDSWGRGEWAKDTQIIVHKGLEQYILDDGYTVINYSEPGADCNRIINQIPKLGERDLLVIFTTDFQRGQIDWHKQSSQSITDFLYHRNDCKNYFIKCITKKLLKCTGQVLLLGCLGVFNIDDKIKNKNVAIIPNFCEWLFPDNNFIKDYLFYTRDYNFNLLYNLIRNNRNRPLLEAILHQVNINKKIFVNDYFPDNAHPDRRCHFKLYEHIKEHYLKPQ